MANPLAAYQNAFNHVSGLADQARSNMFSRRAGNALASGDPSQAAKIMYEGGFLDSGAEIQKTQAAAQKAQLEQQETQRKRQAEAAQRIAKGMRGVMAQGGDAATAWAAATHYAPALGLDPAELEKIKPYFDQDPQRFLDFIDQQAEAELQAVNLGNGGVAVFNKSTGDLRVAREPQFQQEYVALPPGGALVPKPRGNAPPQTVTADPSGSGDWLAAVAQAAPDAQVTSGFRTPERNAAVGGQPNSRHLTGEAVDLVPRPGETMAQLHARVSKVPGVRAINEGDHVHVQRVGGGGGSQLPPGTIMGPPKPQSRPATAAEKASMGIPENVPAQIKPDGTFDVVNLPKDGKGSGRLSATVIKMQTDLLQDLGAASSVNAIIDQVITQIDSGALNLGPMTNIGSQARNLVGRSDQNSRNFASFRASLEKMRNDSLRLNKGVQTEGDAQRAWNELIANIGDENLVRQRLEEIRGLNEQAIALRQDLVNQAREDSGMEPLDANRFRAKPVRGRDNGGGSQLPPQARAQLKAGQITTFANGQRWTLLNGQPQRVN